MKIIYNKKNRSLILESELDIEKLQIEAIYNILVLDQIDVKENKNSDSKSIEVELK